MLSKDDFDWIRSLKSYEEYQHECRPVRQVQDVVTHDELLAEARAKIAPEVLAEFDDLQLGPWIDQARSGVDSVIGVVRTLEQMLRTMLHHRDRGEPATVDIVGISLKRNGKTRRGK